MLVRPTDLSIQTIGPFAQLSLVHKCIGDFSSTELLGAAPLTPGQPATELSGGEAQRIKLATELQRAQRGNTLYILDEPTTGLHPADVERLITQLDGLVQLGNTVILVERDMRVAAASDWVIDIGPGAGEEGSRVVAVGTVTEVPKASRSRTAQYLAAFLQLAEESIRNQFQKSANSGNTVQRNIPPIQAKSSLT